jgi:hypothetical protein
LACGIGGRRTQSVFKRHNLVSPGDLRLAAGRLDYNESYTNGYSNSTVGESATERPETIRKIYGEVAERLKAAVC